MMETTASRLAIVNPLTMLVLLAAVWWGALMAPAKAADFDFFVLSLSWSPSWCMANDYGGRTRQCNGLSSYGFIAHGLWPQNERGWPEYCGNGPDRVPDSLARDYRDIIPSAGLAGHEWRKHGSCSGLDQPRYFSALRAAYAKIRLPPVVFDGKIDRRLAIADIETSFVKANPGLDPKGIAIGCEQGRLSEIRICMTKSLAFRACAEVDRGGCRQRIVTIPSIP